MRLRIVVLASLLAACVAVLAPTGAGAAPAQSEAVTINVVPSQIIAGEGVFIYGQLRGGNVSDQVIRLYHRIDPRHGFTLVSSTSTDASGFYAFPRAEGVVLTNRSWFVRGPDGVRSRTVFESVSALVSMTASTLEATTRHPVVFTGTVTPLHRFEPVILQARTEGENWHSLATSFTRGDSSYRIAYRWRLPGVRDVRVLFPGDGRNVEGASAPVTITVQQQEIPAFTIESASAVITEGGSTTISGVLERAATLATEPGVPVTLLAHTPGMTGFLAIATTTTDDHGDYAFTEAPTQNTTYVVRVTLHPRRHSAYLFEGVRDLVTSTPSTSQAPVGTVITFTGAVVPGQPGDLVALERLGKDGYWHEVDLATVNRASGYTLTWTLGDTGTDVFRVRSLSDPENLGGVSASMPITVTPATSLATLPPAS